MSRSCVTTGASDKRYKTAEQLRERYAVRNALRASAEMPAPKSFGDPWHGDKDGKIFYADRPEVIRK